MPPRPWVAVHEVGHRGAIRPLTPQQAAEIAAREYDSTHPAAWVKRRRK